MISLNIDVRVLSLHKDFVFGDNKNKKSRLYKKLEGLYHEENNRFCRNVLKLIRERLEIILIGDIYELDKIKDVYLYLLNSIPDTQLRDDLYEKIKNVFHLEYKHFYYARKWNAYLYQKQLELTICPYCGTQFIFLYESDNGRTRGTLDHFFDKATYPILAISIYNLIPSCKVCNSDFKGIEKVDLKTHYTPYEKDIIQFINFKREIIKEKSDEISSAIEKKIKELSYSDDIDYVAVLLGEDEEFNIRIDYSNAPEDKAKKIKGNLKLFQIEEVYNTFHKPYVQKIIRDATIYNYIYKQQLLNSFPVIFNSLDELKDSIIPSINEDKNQILGKLTRDIVETEIKHLTF
ncbi:hypothetical protein [Sporosarcina newyorkensis]|uniref:HNH endonuclease n=1 Tax=Sporosarcina newyorkensis TaxID=759851 RepID=A0A1T4YIF6_9BACL|nr:hypothetical protein [Sporosarcina newyorkensis]SKB01318.1 hypothetical protein SAMN04244570_2670 [Sporosarcina newyorkensis]